TAKRSPRSTRWRESSSATAETRFTFPVERVPLKSPFPEAVAVIAPIEHVPSRRCFSCGRRRSHAHEGCAPPPTWLHPIPLGPLHAHEIDLAREGYRVVRRLGVGGFGSVYEVRDPGGAPLALKVARADRHDAFDRLLREAAALAEIGPPHVPAVFASRRLADGTPYLVMELLRIPTLAQRLDEAAGPTPIEQWVSIARIVMEALGAVHSRGFVHADLKPENIFLAPNLTRACLVDFGLAASASSS